MTLIPHHGTMKHLKIHPLPSHVLRLSRIIKASFLRKSLSTQTHPEEAGGNAKLFINPNDV